VYDERADHLTVTLDGITIFTPHQMVYDFDAEHRLIRSAFRFPELPNSPESEVVMYTYRDDGFDVGEIHATGTSPMPASPRRDCRRRTSASRRRMLRDAALTGFTDRDEHRGTRDSP
jgi:hypothetical protein